IGQDGPCPHTPARRLLTDPSCATLLHSTPRVNAFSRLGEPEFLERLAGPAGGQIGQPLGLGLSDQQPEPEPGTGRRRTATEPQAHLGGEPVLLFPVAPAAGGDHVVPYVAAAAATRQDVVDVLG